MNWLTPTLILEFIIGLVLLIIIHEFGHFIAARLSKVGVDEFGVGFPPRLARLFTWSGTEFSLNWIPLGGFVRLKGEGDPSVEGGLAAANPWVRLIVYLAGPMANLLVGALLFTLVFAQLGMIPDMRSVQLDLVEPGSPAENAGLLVDDIVKSADGQLISTTEQLRTIIYSHLGEPFEIVLVRNGEEIAVVVTPRAEVEPGQGALGVVMGNPSRPFSLGAGLAAGFNQIAEYTRSLVDVGGKLVSRQAHIRRCGSGRYRRDGGVLCRNAPKRASTWCPSQCKQPGILRYHQCFSGFVEPLANPGSGWRTHSVNITRINHWEKSASKI